VLAEFPESRTVPRVVFTLAQIMERDSAGGHERADSLRKELIARFPDSDFADEARRQLGIAVVPKAVDPAEVKYRQAEGILLSREPDQAKDSLKSIVESFPGSPFAPRAQYAIGWIYENSLGQMDSAIATYKRLVEKYPSSPYAEKVRPLLVVVAAYQNSQMMKKDSSAARPDSLTEQQRRMLETLPADDVPKKEPVNVKPPPKKEPAAEPKVIKEFPL
jgi:hypothetical protein